MVDSDADDDDEPGAEGSGLFDEGLVPLLMGLPGDLQTSASMLYDDEVGDLADNKNQMTKKYARMVAV
jgi:hypothetical protein